MVTTVNGTVGAAVGFGVTHAMSADAATLYVAHGDALNGNLIVESLNNGQWSRHVEPPAPVVNNSYGARYIRYETEHYRDARWGRGRP